MKLRLLLPGIVVPGLVALTGTSLSQEESPNPRIPVSQATSPPVTNQIVTNQRAANSEFSTPPANPLREQYLELVRARAELMDEATLQQEIQVTQQKISELRASQKLNEAQQLLLAIMADFPDSAAAARAVRMLDAAEPQAAQADYFSEEPDTGKAPAVNTAAEGSFRRSSFENVLPTEDLSRNRAVPAKNRSGNIDSTAAKR